MQKRSLFEMIFGNKETNENLKEVTLFKLLNGYEKKYSGIGKEIFDVKIARQCINTLATHTAKLEPKHLINGRRFDKGDINYLLSIRPNPLNSTYDFLYRIRSQYEDKGNAYVFIQKDKTGKIEAFYPIVADEEQIVETPDKRLFLKFKFDGKKDEILPYEELIHLRKFYNQNDFFGEDNRVLRKDLETSNIIAEGVKNAIESSSNLRGILQFNALLKDEDIQKAKEKFVSDYLTSKNSSGIASLDSKAKFEPIKIDPILLTKDQIEILNKNIYDYFGVNEAIINNSFTADEWNSFYEGCIEPFAMQLSYEFTYKIFSDNAIKNGNEIVFTTNRVQYNSIDQKVKLLKEILPYGLVTKNTALGILDLPQLDGEEGNKILQSLNNINSKIADTYQGGGDSE